MLKVRVMPCLLLKGWGLVKTVRFDNPSYVGDPINTVRIYNEKEVDELIFLDITATPRGAKPPFEIISEIASECFMPFTYGGGVNNIEDAKTIFSLGAEKVALNTFAHANPGFIRQLADRFGSQSIVVSIDVRKTLLGKYHVCTHGGKKDLKIDPVSAAQAMEQAGCGEILLTSIDRDGTWAGYDTELTRRVSSAVSVPVIACGGAGCVDDFVKAVKLGGASAVAAGSMVVYQGKGRGVLINFPSKADLKSVE
jgi:cyclase